MKNKIRLLALTLSAALLSAGLSACAMVPPIFPGESSQPSPSFSQGSRSEAGEPEEESRAEGSSGGAVEGGPEQSGAHTAFGISAPSSSSHSSSQAFSGSSSQSSSSHSSSQSSSGPASSSSQASSASEAVEELRVGPGLEDISQLIGLKADVETRRHACVVDVDNGENPYDVTWDYGKLYDAFVEEVDWDLFFDADYYIETFPGLAHLYHNDKDLLLRHFQTVGIHEGRQGCESFNVAAYQKNCAARVRKAFGDEYACYYFYYALNQKTQKSVSATGDERRQLTVKLTNMQQTELDHINKYRAEVGAEPLEYDPELSALACYRAYIDALEDWDAHDWIKAPENEAETNELFAMLSTSLWSENTVHGYFHDREYALEKLGPSTPWYLNYRHSEPHYQAMIDERFHYLGSANCYVSDYEKVNPEHPNATTVYIHFDVFTSDLITPLHS